ncbi:nucleoside triphosphate hydrolase [Rhizobium sp. 'Codium 1']|uniref:nucleoside triphosphate hydrolase n=1 Tax=Rhizobium sp. 'Codium 1' TaxID=2940484 RepID=UPI001E5319F4|nr:nucleoside triphosphate hydrolase [Rhizobium sp. 'Codium 1']MCC8931607.1 nucleoside triphosphate hydrolase [Rhizobium sp. 'Codium 1']
MSSELDDLLFEIERRAHGGARLLVGVAGPPGAGKSTLADRLHAALGERGHRSAVLPMDGFHLDNSILDERGDLPRKGAPHTFDVRGLADLLRAVKAGGEVFVPVFDRARELAIAAARCISPEDRIVIAEGNYLLLDQGPWADLADLFDLSVMVAPPIEELERRLIARWVGYGLTPAQIEAKVENNDLPNGRLVLQRSRPADFTFDQF